ncbi:hypothetical protein ACFFGV_16960 [Pontibacillus salicampi]|uniref:Uncharacterized protein n=1 Tax=Pontibacillus salicampi TaxID=1449801 RepID=A0ABV6LSG1_9BACI
MGKLKYVGVAFLAVVALSLVLYGIFKPDLSFVMDWGKNDNPSTQQEAADQMTNTASAESSQQSDAGESEEENTTAEGEAGTEEYVEEVDMDLSLGDFIAQMHSFYNNTLGYGGYKSIDDQKQREQARKVLSYLQGQDSYEEIEWSDIESIQAHAQTALAKMDPSSDDDPTQSLLYLHRYFHDLDVGLNDYDAAEKIWGVTKTVGKGN